MKYFLACFVAIIILLAGVSLLGCAGNSETVATTTTTLATTTTSTTVTTTSTILTSTTTSTSMTTTTQVTWSEESLTWTGTIEPVTSTCTIITPEGTYRQYFTGPGGIWTFSSTDGLSWSAPILALSQTGATNPAVIQVTDGSFVMIYGIQTVNPITERLYRATSPDGLTFSAYIGPYANGAIFSGEANGDFVSVPDLIYINGTTLRMYYVGSTTTSRIYTATSTDNGQSWTREGEITLSGSYGGQTNDPDI